MFRNSRTKDYFRLRALYLPLIIVPLILFLVLSICVFFITNNQLRETGRINVEKFASQAGSVLSELKIVNDSLLGNEHFVDLVSEDVTGVDEQTAISRIINNQLNKSSYVQDAYVVSPSQGKIYTADASYSIESLPSLLIAVNVITDPDSGFSVDDLEDGWSVPSNSFSSPYYVSRILDRAQTKKATLLVILNKGYLYRTLFTTNSAYCCMYNDDFLISSAFKNDQNVDYTSAKDIEKLLGHSVEVFTMQSDNYTYLTALAKNSFYRPLYIILAVFAAYILIVIAFSVIHVYRTNRHEKAFFNDLVSSLPQPETDDAGIQNIFVSIQNALEDYKQEHQAFSEQRKFRNLERLTKGYLDLNRHEIVAASMGLDTDAAFYYCMRMHVTEVGILNPEHRSDLTSIILESAINGFSEGKFHAVCFPVDNHDLLGILNVTDKDVDSSFIHKVLKHAYTLLEKDYGTLFTCTLSSPVPDIESIPEAAAETEDLLRFTRAIDSNAKFVAAERLQASPGFLIKGAFLKQLQILSNTLLLGKYDVVPKMVDTIMEDHITPLRKNYSMVQTRMQCIKTILFESPLPERMDPERIEEIHTSLRQADSVSTLSENVHRCFELIQKESAESVSPVDKACEFIHDQISNVTLSTPEVAEYAGVSVQHLARLFKSELHMTMVEYINQYRITRSKELLTSTSFTVSEIAERAGYCNNVTFTRNFKKYVGCTPGEYRERSQQN